jgi:hypothetical protein
MKQLSFFVPFGKRKFSDFVLDLHKSFMKLLDFQLVFLFKLFETQVSGCFVVGHVVVPGAAEF